MKIISINKNVHTYKNNNINSKSIDNRSTQPIKPNQNINFKGNLLKDIFVKVERNLQFKKAQKFATDLHNYVIKNGKENEFLLRQIDMDKLEGLQNGIKVFEGMTMKEIQYTSEFLHVIAVKRGCTHMCGHCYASAKPSNRQMSFEDFTDITDGFKTIRERLHGLDIYGSNIKVTGEDRGLYASTELFYDADCMDIVLKDKNGKEHDFTELASILYDSLNRKTVFDTAGWNKNNEKLQKRAEKYAEYFANPENMDMLKQFNVSFNVFNASYIASRKALKNGDYDKAKRLKEKFLDNSANALFTFTPVAHNDNFNVLVRAFHPSVKNSNDYNAKNMTLLLKNLMEKLQQLYINDLKGEQKFVKTMNDCKKYINIYAVKLGKIDTRLNNSGRMREFVKEHNLQNTGLQNLDEHIPQIIENLYPSDRLSKIIHHRLIDADGRVYYMDYARVIPTEIQLNISGKNEPTPKFDGLLKDIVITKDNINY